MLTMEKLRTLVLPPRLPMGSKGNAERVRRVAAAYHQERVSRMRPDRKSIHKIGCSLCRVRLRWRE
jgi:hypothetical protein